ncbi:glutamate receptor ionotropic, delta-2 [Procambarus clarkii]|uniref:glutamate receptor ionotropic, delta-2 n=1 Tax=Procambarus clarkii TaxID=6728 RepID=UPI001E673A5D|nr:glutamate receptor ionotropic, delta-2-like isoform X2 [Procambarus clarkii]
MSVSGRQLRVGTGYWVPWVDLHSHPDGTLTADGVAVTILDIIAKKLNFTYVLVGNADIEWGQEAQNGSFTGLMGMCVGEEVDVALGPFVITYRRSQVADFSMPLYFESWGIFLPRPRLESDLAGFLKPFTWQVWEVLGGMILLTMVLGAVLNWLASGSWRGPDAGIKEEPSGGVFRPSWVLRTLVNEDTNELPRTAVGRLLLGTWLVGSFILCSAYQGVLTSLLTVPLVSVPVNSLEDLVSYGKIPWALEFGTVIQQEFKEAKAGVNKVVYEGSSAVRSTWDARDSIKEGKLAMIADDFSMIKITNDDYSNTGECHYYIGKEMFRSAPLAYCFPKGSPLVQHFNKWIALLQESGLVSRSVLALTSNASACLVPPGKEGGGNQSLVLTFPDLAGVFLLLVAGLGVGTLACVVEMFSSCWKV